MTSKHTPGPWITVSNGGDDPDERELLVGKNDRHGDFTVIADCRSKWLSDEIGGSEEANARLIVAAPDLLEVAKGCLGWLRAIPADQRPDAQWLAPLEAAIAKAEGC